MASKKRGKPSQHVEEYKKELKRIKNFISSAEKRGYDFGDFSLTTPKNITANSVEKLKKITPQYLYAQATFYDVTLEQYVSGTEEQFLVRARAANKRRKAPKRAEEIKPTGEIPNETDEVLLHIESLISGWTPMPHWSSTYEPLKRRDKNILSNIIRGAISSMGRQQVARNVQAQAGLVKTLAFNILYGSSDFKWCDIEGEITAITEIIYGRRLNRDESMQLYDAAIEPALSYENP